MLKCKAILNHVVFIFKDEVHQGQFAEEKIGSIILANKGKDFKSDANLSRLATVHGVGPECKSAVMVRQTATVGALVLRLHRDDVWINEMIYWLQKFQTNYVNMNIPPPRNFFYNDTSSREEQSRYRRFVNRTLELRNQVQVVAFIPNDEIQRVPGNTSLFLD